MVVACNITNYVIIIIMTTYFIDALGEIMVGQVPDITYRRYYRVSVPSVAKNLRNILKFISSVYVGSRSMKKKKILNSRYKNDRGF